MNKLRFSRLKMLFQLYFWIAIMGAGLTILAFAAFREPSIVIAFIAGGLSSYFSKERLIAWWHSWPPLRAIIWHT